MYCYGSNVIDLLYSLCIGLSWEDFGKWVYRRCGYFGGCVCVLGGMMFFDGGVRGMMIGVGLS